MTPAPSGADRVYARYWIETAYPLEAAAASMAGEQSTGTFTRVPGETDELRERYAARVEQLVEGDRAAGPSLPGSGLPMGAGSNSVRRTAEVTLSWPMENMGASLPNLLATIAGNLFELKQFSGLKLLDVTLPPIFLEHHGGSAICCFGNACLHRCFWPSADRHHYQAIGRHDPGGHGRAGGHSGGGEY